MRIRDLIEKLENIEDKGLKIYFADSNYELTQITEVLEARVDGEDVVLVG